MQIPLRSLRNRLPKPGQLDQYPLDAKDIQVIFADSQRKQISLTPMQEAKIAEMVRKNPMSGIKLTWNQITGEVDIREAK